MNLKEIQEAIHKTAKEKGWWDESREIPEMIALIHSEVSEALEEYRLHDIRSIYYNKDKPEGFSIELADIIIRILDMAAGLGIALEKAIKLKMLYNETRPYRHGGKKI